MNDVRALVSIVVADQPQPIWDGITRPRAEGVHRERAIPVGLPDVHIIGILHRVNDVRSAVSIVIAWQPEAIGNGVALPGAEGVDPKVLPGNPDRAGALAVIG